MEFNIIQNLDLFFVGLTVATIGILGFTVFFNNQKSLTNRTFLVFSLITIFWGIVNYLSYQFSDIQTTLLFLRLVIFFAVWHAFIFFQLFYIFPKEKLFFPKWYKFFLFPIVLLSSIVNLTSLSFSKIIKFGGIGAVSVIEQGPGIFLFGGLVVFLVIDGIFLLIKKIKKTSGLERKQFKFVTAGVFITFSLILVFNFILPVVFDQVRFIPLAPVFLLPFVIFTAYAIIRHHLLNVKVIAAELLTFGLLVASLVQIILATTISILIFSVLVSVFLLFAGILLIKSVRQEVKQREKLQELTEKLEAANVKLTDLSRFKTELLSLASHQVKSPLAVIKGYASILLDGLYGKMNGKVKDTVFKMKESTEGLIILVNNLLDLRKIEEGKMEYQFQPLKLKELIAGVVSELKPLAESKKLELTFSAESDKSVKADVVKLKQVVQNLVDNAIKYTPQGFVKVELKEDGGWLVLFVKDSGLGMSKELLPLVFQEFIRDERVKKEIRGTGLGLYIAKKIVEAHNGEIWAESAGEGKGSEFFVKLKIIN